MSMLQSWVVNSHTLPMTNLNIIQQPESVSEPSLTH